MSSIKKWKLIIELREWMTSMRQNECEETREDNNDDNNSKDEDDSQI